MMAESTHSSTIPNFLAETSQRKMKHFQATLNTSAWGRIISLKEIGISLPNQRDMAFLEYGGNCRDFTVGETYNVTLTFYVSYLSIVKKREGPEEREEKFLTQFRTTTYESAKSHPEFVRMKLTEDSIVPYFTIIPN